MKKFRVTHDCFMGLFFIQKRFLWIFWIYPNNDGCYLTHNEVYDAMKKISKNENRSFVNASSKWHVLEGIEYYDSAEDYLNKNSEYMI